MQYWTTNIFTKNFLKKSQRWENLLETKSWWQTDWSTLTLQVSVLDIVSKAVLCCCGVSHTAVQPFSPWITCTVYMCVHVSVLDRAQLGSLVLQLTLGRTKWHWLLFCSRVYIASSRKQYPHIHLNGPPAHLPYVKGNVLLLLDVWLCYTAL